MTATQLIRKQECLLHFVRHRFARFAMVIAAMALLAAQPVLADEAPERDLQGILPEVVPDGLTVDDFDQLTDNWAGWAAETGQLVSDFYEGIYTDDEYDEILSPAVQARRVTLERLKIKLRTMETSLNDPQYLSIYGTLADLHGRLSRRIGVAEALMTTLDQDVTATAQARFADSLTGLAGSATALRSHLGGIAGGEKWVNYIRLNEIVDGAGSGDTSDAMVELLVGVHGKLDARTEFAEKQRAFLSREPVLQFEDALVGALSMQEAKDPEGFRQHLRDLAAALIEALEEHEASPTAEQMQAVRHLYDDIRRAAPDGGAVLTEAMRLHYLNYNLRVVMDETLMQDVVRDTRVESGFINEMVAGAKVTGCQMTNTTVNMDLKPCDDGIRIDLILNGTVRSSAQGETHVATVFTTGRHCFTARKSVHFDGDHFQHWCATVSVGGANCPYAAQTCLSWAPILGGLSEDFAIKVANSKSSETNAFSLNKIRREVSTQFNRETSKMLNEAELGLEDKVAGPLRAGGYYPDIKEFRSTETEMLMRTRLMESGELGGGDVLPVPIYPTHGVLVQIHESLLNQIGDRLELGGKRFTPDELKAYLEAEASSVAGGKTVDLGNMLPSPDEGDAEAEKIEVIVFHETDAIRFQIRDGNVVLLLNMGLKIEGRDEIAPVKLRVPLTVSLADGMIRIDKVEARDVGVLPIGRPAPGHALTAGIMRTKLAKTFKPQEFDSIFTLDAGEKKKVTLQITDLRAHSGWLSIIATDGITETGEPSSPAGQPMQQARINRKGITR